MMIDMTTARPVFLQHILILVQTLRHSIWLMINMERRTIESHCMHHHSSDMGKALGSQVWALGGRT